MTSNPFGVNLTLLPSINPPDYGAYAQAIIDEGVRIVETAGYSPGVVIAKFKAAGCIVLHKCTTIKHALSAVKLGADFLSIDGFECAGHVGETDITNFILLSRARQALGGVPFIASGGFADGQGLAAALSLGAEGSKYKSIVCFFDFWFTYKKSSQLRHKIHVHHRGAHTRQHQAGDCGRAGDGHGAGAAPVEEHEQAVQEQDD